LLSVAKVTFKGYSRSSAMTSYHFLLVFATIMMSK